MNQPVSLQYPTFPVVAFRLLWIFASVIILYGHSSLSAQQRPYQLDDDFAREEFFPHEVRFSPDGQAVVFTRLRPIHTQPNPSLVPAARGDIWVRDVPGQPARNLTQGLDDNSGWWAPQWSPDGQRLAFLSSRGGYVALWLWERQINRIRQVSLDAVDYEEKNRSRLSIFRWIDNTRVIYLGFTNDERPAPVDNYHSMFAGGGRPVERATEAWAKAARGELSVSVVDSLEFRYPQRRLVVRDVMTGDASVLGLTRTSYGDSWWISPNARIIAFLTPGPVRRSGADSTMLDLPADLALRSLDGRPVPLSGPLPSNIITNSLRYSPSSKELAFFALGDAAVSPTLLHGEETARDILGASTVSVETPLRLWRVALDEGRVEEISLQALDLGRAFRPPAFAWTASDDLLIRATLRRTGATETDSAPSWLILGRNGKISKVPGDPSALPEDLTSGDGGASFIGVKDGEVCSLHPATGARKSLTSELTPAVKYIHDLGSGAGTSYVVVSAAAAPRAAANTRLTSAFDGGLDGYYLLDVLSGHAIPLTRPAVRATLAAHHRASGSFIWYDNSRLGTFLWKGTVDGTIEQLAAANTFFRNIATGEERFVDYTTLNGETMRARLVLPINYRPGRRYPLVVDFDIGANPVSNAAFRSVDALSLPQSSVHAFTAAGYAYLFTSWPTTSMDNIGRGNLLLGLNGVMPAVTKVVDMGIVDADRLFVHSVSSGGFGLFGLITQTSRFKAAAVSAGWVDQTAEPLTPGIGRRYSDNPFDLPFFGARYISRRLPVWRIADLLRRNSPLSYVDRVQTPLLILHGDLDPVPIEEPEKFFMALVMQRKPARFVRYWGEGHNPRSPANRRDYYQRIFAWFDEYGDITRNADGEIVFDGEHAKSRNGAPPLTPDAFSHFGPAAPATRTPDNASH